MHDLDAKGMNMEMQTDLAAMTTSGPVPATDLRHEIAWADLILAATVVRVSGASGPTSLVSPKAQPTTDQLREAELVVLRILAGEHDGGPVRVFFLMGNAPSRLWMELSRGQTLLLFLRSIDGAYVPVGPTEIPIQTLPEIPRPLAGVSRTLAVSHELEQIILSADPICAASLIIHATIARVGLRGNVDLHLLETPALLVSVRRAAWVAIALAEGKLEALDEVPPLFANPAPPPAEVLWNLIVQKVSEVRAPTARQQLAVLSQNARVDLARASASALRQLHDPATKPDLIETLNNADLEVRYQAVMGLAELEPSVKAGPSFEVYRSGESIYIQQWKHWWESSRRSRINKSSD